MPANKLTGFGSKIDLTNCYYKKFSLELIGHLLYGHENGPVIPLLAKLFICKTMAEDSNNHARFFFLKKLS